LKNFIKNRLTAKSTELTSDFTGALPRFI